MFHELLDNPNRVEPGPLQAAARKQFADVVRRSHLALLEAAQHPPYSGKFVLIGVAVYSPGELQLLDDLNAAYADWRDIAKVAVFDVMDCKDTSDVIRRYILPPPHRPNPLGPRVLPQSPIVGIWDGAVLSAFETGLYGTQKLLRDERLLK